MRAATGIFVTSEGARRAMEELGAIGIREERRNLLSPGAPRRDLEAVPTTEAEQPGVGPALGAVVGGAAGATGGIHIALGAAAAAAVPG
ncbi:MAG: hypothetical protein ACREMB_00250, partial [Candidatus Rokuibacteriota bacterium]